MRKRKLPPPDSPEIRNCGFTAGSFVCRLFLKREKVSRFFFSPPETGMLYKVGMFLIL